MVDTLDKYDEVIGLCRETMINKNHDYGDSWRDMRLTSITDQILVKVKENRYEQDN